MSDLVDRFDRTALMLLLAGAANDASTANAILERLKLHLHIGSTSPAAQRVALAAASCGVRTFLGGLTYAFDAEVDRNQSLAHFSEQLESIGAARSEVIPNEAATIGIATRKSASLHAFVDGYRAGVVKNEGDAVVSGAFTPSFTYAGALLVGEAFQRRIFELTDGQTGNIRAMRRDLGINLISPSQDWRSPLVSDIELTLPMEYWIVGTGNTGQALAYIIGELPYTSPENVNIVLQDYDSVTVANLSTSVLTTRRWLGQRKTRMVSAYLERRGFRPRIVEQLFGHHSTIAHNDPTLAFSCVDKKLPRRFLENAGFRSIIDIGLGGRPDNCMTYRLVTFPGDRSSYDWFTETIGEAAPREINETMRNAFGCHADQCGVETLLGQTAVGIPYVGLMAASLALAQAIRRVSTGEWCAIIDGSTADKQLYVEQPSPDSGLVVHLGERISAPTR